MALLKRDSHHYTYADYIRWSGTYGEELIDGTAYVREPPAPSPSHQGIVVGLCHQVNAALKDKPCRVYVAPFDVRLPKSAEEDDQVDTVVQPDVLIVCDLQKIDARGMRGAPDWVAEVLSPYTASHDQVVKLPLTSAPASAKSGSYIPSIAPWLFTGSKRDVTDARAFSNSREKHRSLLCPA